MSVGGSREAAPSWVKVVNLRPRPTALCGHLDQQWKIFEPRGLGTIGRNTLCQQKCGQFSSCFWPIQFHKTNLKGASVVFGTHAYLESNPSMLRYIADKTGANRVLLVMDEANWVMTSSRKVINQEELKLFLSILGSVEHSDGTDDIVFDWISLIEKLIKADTTTLRDIDWALPPLPQAISSTIQHQGWNRYGQKFKCLAPNLARLCESPPLSRERVDGGISYSSPMLERIGDIVIYSASSRPALVEHRLGQKFAFPFVGHQFRHSKTQWSNLASRIGMRSYFPKNSPQILDFFATLIVPAS